MEGGGSGQAPLLCGFQEKDRVGKKVRTVQFESFQGAGLGIGTVLRWLELGPRGVVLSAKVRQRRLLGFGINGLLPRGS